MSHFPGKTIEEIAELTAEQVDRYTKLAMANAGIPIFVEVGEAPKSEVAKDSAIFKVGDFAFDDRTTAEEVKNYIADLPRVKQRYNTRTWNIEETWESSEDAVEVVRVPLYSPKLYSEKSAILAYHKQLSEEREKLMEGAAKFDRERDALTTAINAELNDARQYVRNRDRVVNLYHQYLDLAEGDRQIAWNFLNKIERLSAEDIAEMKLAERIQLDGLQLEWTDATVPELQAV